MFNNTTGGNNTGVGNSTLMNNTTGVNNTAIGNEALILATTSSNNTAIGVSSLYRMTTGMNNSALGYGSGLYDVSGNSNTYLGASSSQLQGDNNVYHNSTAIGYNSVINASNQIMLGGLYTSTYPTVFIPSGNINLGNNCSILTSTINSLSNFSINAGATGTVAVTGNISATGSITSGSDYRIKENVTPLDDSFTIDNLRPVTYKHTVAQKQDIGFIAHEVQEVFPFLVNGEKDGENLQTLNYTGLIGILVKEIQDLKKHVKLLEEKMNKI